MIADSPSLPPARLHYAASDRDGDQLWSTGFFAADPFLSLEINGHKAILVSDLELDRARAEAGVDEVVSSGPLRRELETGLGRPPSSEAVIAAWLDRRGIDRVSVPGTFPLGLAEGLRRSGMTVAVAPEPFHPARQRKGERELAALAEAQAAAEQALARALALLGRAAIDGDRLRLDGEPLTAERLRAEINHSLVDLGFQALDAIVAGGDQGCLPHARGAGPLPANRTIVLDIFPRSRQTHYCGDLTRTVVRGRAAPAVRELYAAVRDGQERALGLVRAGAAGGTVHQAVVDLFDQRGYRTEKVDGQWRGFFHGLGHGVGLEVHEPPRIGRDSGPLETGQVVTVEPGLYYPGLGAVRLEDLVAVEADGCRNLTRAPKVLEIP